MQLTMIQIMIYIIVIRGTVLKKLNRNDESLDCFNKALKINPENKNALKAKKELN